MSHVFPRILPSWTRTALSAALVAWLPVTAALADDYSDVAQLLRSGKHAEALSRADQYLSAKPKDPQMRFLKGVVQTEAGKQAEAVATFTKLTEDYPELPEPYNNLAVLHAGLSQYDKARAALEMAIRTNPSYATAHENLGDVYAKLASQAYSKALQLDSGNTAVPPKLNLIRQLFAPGNKAQRPTAAAPVPAPAPAVAPAAPAAAAAAPVAAAKPAPAPTPAPVPTTKPAEAAPGSADVEAAVKAWAAAWSAKDMSAYLGSYAKEFDTPGNQSRKAWEEERRKRIEGKSKISVRLSDIVVQLNGNKATVRFRQDYTADRLNVSSRKTLELTQSGDRWHIVRETTGG